MAIKTSLYKDSFQLSVLDKVLYGAGNLGFGIVFQSVATFLMLYATVILGLPGRYIGIIMSLGVFWDAITDPIMGYISDVTNFKKYGRRHFYILWGTVIIAIFNYWLWTISPQYSQLWKLIILFFSIFLLKAGMTIYSTPYIALGVELSQDYNERTSIQSYRIFFFLTGLAFPVVMGILLFFRSTEEFPMGQLNPAGYRFMGLTTSILMLLTGLLCYIATKKTIPYLPKIIKNDEGKSNFKRLFTMFYDATRNRYFRYIFYGYLLVNIASALIGTLGLHMFTYTFRMNSNQIAITMGVFFFTTIISQPFWAKYSAIKDKQPSMKHSILISLSGCFILTLLIFTRGFVFTNYWLLLPVFCVIGFGAGGLFLFPPSMVGDVIDVEALQTGKRAEGIYFGSMTFGYKASQSIALFLVGFSLDIIGFDSNAMVQTNSTAIMIGLMLCVGSIVVLAAAYFTYNKYTLTKDIILDVQRKLHKKDEAINS